MANNRIYLKCKICGEKLYLGKSGGFGYNPFDIFGDGDAYYWQYYPTPKGDNHEHLEDNLNEFFYKHNYCACGKKQGGRGDFKIEYEFKE